MWASESERGRGRQVKIPAGDFSLYAALKRAEGAARASFSLFIPADKWSFTAACRQKAQRAERVNMNTSSSWICLYFLLFIIVQERCDACDWMINQYSIKSRFCLSQLKDMVSQWGSFTSLNVGLYWGHYSDSHSNPFNLILIFIITAVS